MDLYLAGGALRNLLLGKPESDRDYVWFGEEADLLTLLPGARQVGKAFPVYLHHGSEYAKGRGEDIHADLAARDLTINALALGIQGHNAGRLLLHPNAGHDLTHGWLRPASPAAFVEDPLRVFRLARFAAAFPEFRLSLEAVAAMRHIANAGLLNNLDAERVGAELLKALATPMPGRFLEVLDRGDCLAPWFSPLEKGATIPAGPPQYHGATSVLQHTCNVMNAIAAGAGPNDAPRDVSDAAWLGLCHDLGKCLSPAGKLPRHHNHELRGQPLAKVLAERLRLSAWHRKAGEAASLQHMKLGGYDRLRPGTKVDVLAAVHRLDLLPPMLALAQADREQVGLGESYAPIAESIRQDLRAILAVRLPAALRNQGAYSGRRLREMRCNAILRGAAAPGSFEKDGSQSS